MKERKKQIVNLLISLIALAASSMTSAADNNNPGGTRTDFRDETIYFVMTTRFYDGDATNNVCSWDKQDVQISKNDPDWRGDFKGLIDKLDYIKALGFTAVWITPVVQNASGEDYHGYHAMDFSSVDLRYESRREWGAEEDVRFQDLIDAAHAKGMKIILDVVLQHTGNFGEARLNPLFKRDGNIRNQASPAACMLPDTGRLSADYFEHDAQSQYRERWKYFKNPQYEPNNYYHHYGTGWNWDYPSRWWGQIAGDCVDLNTENDLVARYIVECYGKFIEMGVDGFRIDTAGHIAPLTFNKQFIPQFLALGEKYKHKRPGGCPFYMFGECCQRYQGTVVYRGQPNLSSYFYTWSSPQELMDSYDGNADWWKSQVLPEGHDKPVGPMAVCEKDVADKPRSNNAWLENGLWHEPDHSQASGLNVIDFPMHYSFNNAAQAISYAGQDNYYNDATYNVVYVDSHDYCPGPNDGVRFNGGTAQWAENLSLMFTFRGIPCIYYGSEVEFKAGKPIDVGGANNKTPRSESGRAYYGAYLEGKVTAADFGVYEAAGNVAATLDGDLAQHIRRLNQIRAAVAALRKGQYTFDGCKAKGGWAFKRAYKDESYALVAINGGAVFSNVPAGTYTDIVTGKTYQSEGTVTVTAPAGKGQLRVLVKDWDKGIVGEDGKYIYADAPVAHGGKPSFADPGTSSYYTAADAVEPPAVKLVPGGKSFATETLEVSATLSETAVWGWVQAGDDEKVYISRGESKTLVIGRDAAPGQTITVSWGAEGGESYGNAEFTGRASYRKIDPDKGFDIYFDNTATGWRQVYCYVYGGTAGNNYIGNWPGKPMSYDSDSGYWHYLIESAKDITDSNIIFNNNQGMQTADNVKIADRGIYNGTGFSGDYFSGVSTIAAHGRTAKTWAKEGTINIESPADATATIIGIDGRTYRRAVKAGTNTIADLPAGFYIIKYSRE